MTIRVFNADDHPILRKGITGLLQETSGIEWIGSAGDGREALEKIKALQPDVAILDIEMPHLTGLQVAQILLEEGCKTQFVLLTLFKEKGFFNNALRIGIKGYLIKESTEKEIIDCVYSVANGRSYVNASLTHYLMGDVGGQSDLLQGLTKHEINILKLIARQKTTAQIAQMLFISPKTVTNHRSKIGKKLKLSGEQNSLLKWAMEHRDLLINR